jgi:hypothetical protein
MMMGVIEDALERLDCLVPRSVVVRSAPDKPRANYPCRRLSGSLLWGLENDVLIIVI